MKQKQKKLIPLIFLLLSILNLLLFNTIRKDSLALVDKTHLSSILQETIPDESIRPLLVSPANNLHTNEISITFWATPSKGSFGRDISYRLLISLDSDFDNKIHMSNWVPAPIFSFAFSNEGSFYWKILAKESTSSDNTAVSTLVRSINIDTTNPSIPTIKLEPPYTNSTNNNICWQSSIDNFYKVLYQVEISQDHFNSTKTESGWIENICFEFTNLSDGITYQYRVKAKDLAGNESNYSETTQSTQDVFPPDISIFNANPSHISPYNPNSHIANKQTAIKAQVNDSHLLTWSLIISDSKHNIISQFDFEDENEKSISWPSLENQTALADGMYFAYIKAEDITGKISYSSSISIYIDNIAPTVKILSPAPNTITNRAPILEIETDPDSFALVAVNKKPLMNSNMTKRFLPIQMKDLREGLNIIEVSAKDLAGNTTLATREFIYDTIPPQKPQIEILPDHTSESISLKISGEKNTKAHILINNTEATILNIDKPSIQSTIIKNWEYNKEYRIKAYLIDTAGNIGSTSAEEIFKTPSQNVLGTGSMRDIDIPYSSNPAKTECNITINTDLKTSRITNCSINTPNLDYIISNGQLGNTYWFEAYGTIQKTLDLKIKYSRCKQRSFFDPRTWFNCVEEEYKNTQTTIKPRSYINAKVDSKILSTYRQSLNANYQFMISSFDFDPIDEKETKITHRILHDIYVDDIRIRLDITSKESKAKKIPVYVEPKEELFGFVFKRFIGVTQWHGYTAYQSPHTGIDFGSFKEPIISPANGYIRTLSWDSYLGECNSGGYFARIEHDNGIHTVYLHLENFIDANNRKWQVGDRIEKGEQIGISGNTGAFNCQSLGYHLHFELRKDQYQKSHTNPVSYIGVDWNQIPTLNWQTYPGRLTGNNPHPNF